MKTWKQEALIPYEPKAEGNTDYHIQMQLLRAVKARKAAQEDYEEAVINAVEHEWTNDRIAKAVGLTEAAIRQYRRRKGIS